MHGTVTFTIDGEPQPFVATLHDDRSWSFTPPLPADSAFIAGHLQRISADYQGPQDGWFGRPQLARAAAFLDGTWEASRPEPKGDPSVVY